MLTMLVSEKNRLGTASVAVRPRIEARISWLKQELEDLRQTLRQSPIWREKDDLLQSVPGVGEQLSLTLPAHLPELGTLDRRQIAGPGGGGTLQSGQRSVVGPSIHLGRAVLGALHAVPGRRGGHPVQPWKPQLNQQV